MASGGAQGGDTPTGLYTPLSSGGSRPRGRDGKDRSRGATPTRPRRQVHPADLYVADDLNSALVDLPDTPDTSPSCALLAQLPRAL